MLCPQVCAPVADSPFRLTEAMGSRALVNSQFVVRGGEVLVIEANPRASRTIPYLSKAIGHPLAKYAALIAAGRSLRDIGFTTAPRPGFYSVKEVTLPFLKFPGVLPVLGAERRSKGESMGIDFDPYRAYYAAQLGAGVCLPDSGAVRLIGDGLEEVAAQFSELGFTVLEGAPPDGADYGLLIDTAGTGELRRALEEGIPL